jgi:hypothetical protein
MTVWIARTIDGSTHFPAVLGHTFFDCGTHLDPNTRRQFSGMSESDHIDLLVRAFKAAWDYYFQPGRNSGVLECLARPALAEFLVSKAREGINDEPSLAAAGLEFLFSLEDPPEEPVDFSPEDISLEKPVAEPGVRWDVHLENASARFLPVKHVRWLSDAA